MEHPDEKVGIRCRNCGASYYFQPPDEGVSRKEVVRKEVGNKGEFTKEHTNN
jgi:hypothetical protein